MLEWVTYERRNWIALAAACFLSGYFIGNGHTTQNSVAALADQVGQKTATVNRLERVVIPKLKANIPKDAGHGKNALPALPVKPLP